MAGQDYIQKSYDLISKDYNVGTIDDFKKSIEKPEGMKKVYDYLSESFNVGDFDSFSKNMLPDKTTLQQGGNFVTQIPVPEPAGPLANVPKPVNPLTNPGYAFESIRRTGTIPTPKTADKEKMIGQTIDENRQLINTELDSVTKDIQSKSEQFRKEHPVLSALSSVRGGTRPGVENEYTSDARYANLSAASRLLDESEQLLKAGNGGGIIAGVKDAASNIDTYSMGLSDLLDNQSVFNALQKYQENKPLTEDEERLLDAVSINAAARLASKEPGLGYTAGSAFVQSVPFMLEMIANPISGAGRSGGKALAKYAAERFAKAGANKLLKGSAKAAGRVAADAMAATGMAMTTGAAGVAADTYNRMSGVPVVDNQFGEIQLSDVKSGESAGKAFYKSLASRSIENFSEMFGEYFGPIGNVLSNTSIGKKLSSSAIINELNKLTYADWAKKYQDILKDGKFNGFIGETAEEYVGGLLNAALVGDQSFEDLASVENLVQTVSAVGLMSGVFGAVNLAGVRSARYQARKKLEKSEKEAYEAIGEDFNSLKEEMLNNDPDSRNAAMESIISSQDLSVKQKQSLINYLYYQNQYDGLLNGENKRVNETIEAENNAIREESNQETGMYVEASLIDPLTGARIPGTIVKGNMDDANLYVTWRGEDGNVKMVKKSDIDPATIQSMPTQDVIDSNATMMQQAAEKEIDHDMSYDPSIPAPEENLGTPFTLPDGNTYRFTSTTAEGGFIAAQLDNEGNVIATTDQITAEDYYNSMQRAIDAVEDANNMSENEAQNETSPSGEESKVSETGTEQVSFPMKGKYIDYSKITEPKMYASALQSEFGDEAVSVLDKMIKIRKEKLEKGSKSSDVIRAKRDENELKQELTMLNGARNIIVPKNISEMVEKVNENVTEPTPVAKETVPESTTEEEAHTEQVSLIPVNEQGVPQYHLTSIDNTLDDLLDGSLSIEEVNSFVDENIKAADKELKEVEKRKPKMGTSKVDYLAQRDAIAEELNAARQKVEYWNNVKKEITPEEQDSQVIDKWMNEEPMNLQELAAQMIATGRLKLLQADYKKQTGYGNKEARKMFGIFASKENGGVSLEKAGEIIELRARGEGLLSENQEIELNSGFEALMDVLTSSNTRGDINNYISRNRERILREEREYQDGLEATMAEQAYGMSLEDYRSYVEAMERDMRQSLLSDEDYAQLQGEIYDDMMAREREYYEEIDEALELDRLNNVKQQKNIEDYGENDEGRNDSLYKGSERVLPETQVNQERGVDNPQESEQAVADTGSEDGVAQESTSGEIKPVGVGHFGNIYDQFKGKVKEAFDFLVKHKEGDLLGVFYRDGIGDIDLVWGNDNGGLRHIIKRHIEEQNDFNDVFEMQSAINDVISNGDIVRENKDKVTLQTDRYKVSINKQYRDEKGNVIERKNWVVTAFDKSKKKGEKKYAPSRETLTTPSSNLNKADGVTLPSNGDISTNKGKEISSKNQREKSKINLAVIQEGIREVDENGYPFVLASDGTTIFGNITPKTGLVEAPIKLSVGFQGNNGKGYGLAHIEANHGEQIRNAGFSSVKDFVSYVARNYDEDNVRVGKRRKNGSQTFLIQITDTHDNTLFIELSKDSSYWNVNSAGIFRKGYSNKKETVVKTEPQQPNNAVSTGSSLSENRKDGIISSEPNGEPTVSENKYTNTSSKNKEKGLKINPNESILDFAQRVVDADTRAKEEQKVEQNPTDAQKEAGNYKKGHIKVDGLDITIEQPKGSVRSGKDRDGKEWSVTMNNTYGYIRGTKGVDGDHIDVFLSDDTSQGNVYVVDQVNPDGSFDEHKVMYGFPDIESAKTAYLSNYEKDWKGLGNITEVSKDDFKKWIDSSVRKSKPFAEYKGYENKSDKSTPAKQENKSVSKNKLVTDERYEELKKRMRAKLGGQMNLGVDPEILAIGTEMAVYHIEKGARKFADYAKNMIDDMGDAIRPYLKSFYNGARDLPEVQQLGWDKDMTSYDEVSKFDIANLGKEEVNPIETAQIVTKEKEVEEQADTAKKKIKKERNKKVKNESKDLPLSINDLFTFKNNDNEQGNTRTDKGLGTEAREETGRPERRGNDRGVHGDNVSDKVGSRSVSGTDSFKQPVVRNTNNFRFSENRGIEIPSGEIAKLKANIEAIKTLKEIEKSGVPATPEQQSKMAKYVGWGGLAEALNESKYNFRNNRYYGDKNWNEKYLPYYEQIKNLLTKEEFDSAVKSTTTSHYTPSEVVNAMWNIAERLGFKGGNISEPAMGIGNILGMIPQSVSGNSYLSGFEIDSLSGRIAKALYPDANIKVEGYEKSFAPNTKDLVITNVPFGKNAPYDKVLDKQFRKKLGSSYNLHNYFILKGLLELKEGGLGVFVTTSATMDGADSRFREYISGNNYDLVGAIRLPNNAFLKGAGTSVTTDILIFRKRKPGESSNGIGYTSTVQIGEGTYQENGEDRTKPIMVNEYFANNPDMMLGEMMTAYDAGSGGLYSGASQTLKAKPGADLGKELGNAINKLPEGILSQSVSQNDKSEVRETTTLKEGTITAKNGKVYVSFQGELKLVKVTDTFIHNGEIRKVADAVNDYNNLKEVLNRLISKEQTKGANPEPTRKELNKVYDEFVAKYGTLNRNKALDDVIAEDVEHGLPLSLESVKRVPSATGKSMVWQVTKADGILNKRVSYPFEIPTKADNISDAVNISKSYKGNIDIPYIAEITGKTEDDVTREMLETGLAYKDPITGNIIDKNTYLSGNVKDKLMEARAAVEDNPEFQKNVDDLENVQPERIPYGDISFRLGTTWIPEEFINAFAETTLGISSANPMFVSEVEEYIVDKNARITDYAKSSEFKTSRLSAIDIFKAALNQRKPKVYDEVSYYEGTSKKTRKVVNEQETQAAAEKIAEMSDKFVEYMDSKTMFHQRIEDVYNDKYNNYVLKKYEKPAFDNYPNANKDIKLRDHQTKAVQRCLSESTLLAHQVGTGKTFTMITTAMEMRRLGIANKPMIVVQNATLEDFVRDFYKLYPSAKILSPSKEERNAENRKRLFNLIATGDFDAIVVPQSFMAFIPDSEERKKAYIQKRIDDFEAAIERIEDRTIQERLRKEVNNLRDSLEGVKKGKNAKGKAKTAESITAKTERILDRRTDDVLTFEQMGVDALFVDEAHNYKKIGFPSKMSNVKGIDTSASQRANSMLLKAQWVAEKNGGRNVILATGTPITNTMAEVWTMMNFVSPDILDAYSIKSFDEFATTFGTVEPSLEFTATGNFKIAERFKSYTNVPELVKAFRSHTDVVLTEDVKEFKQSNNIPKLKDGKMTNVVVEKNEDLEDVMQTLIKELEAFNKLTGKAKKEKSALPLVVFTKAKQAAIDLRLLNPTFPDNPDSKTNKVVENVIELYKESTPDKGTQLIFCDSYQSPSETPKMDLFDVDLSVPQFNLYNDIKRKLIEGGIPASQIAIVSNYEGEKRNALFDKVRTGDVRILIGSTEKMGVGVNVQDRLFALHHIDAPIRPMDFEQRNGRILRQGNLYATWGKPVNVVTYGVKGTLDATAYDRLRIKQNFINQMMKGDTSSRIMEEQDDEDPSGMTFSEMAATLSGDKTAQLLFVAQNKLKKLQNSKRSDLNSKSSMQINISVAKSRLNDFIRRKDEQQKITDIVKSNFPEGIESVTVKGNTINKSISTELAPIVEQYYDDYTLNRNTPPLKISLNNGKGEAIVHFNEGKMVYNLYVDGNKIVENRDFSGAKGLMSSIDRQLESQEKNLSTLKKNIEDEQNKISGLEEAIKKPWGKEEELKAAQQEVEKLQQQLEEKAKQSDIVRQIESESQLDVNGNIIDETIRYRKVTDPSEIEFLENQEKIKVYRAMQVIDGKLYPPMAAAMGGKLIEPIELNKWEKAVERPELAIPDIDSKTGKQKVDKKTGELVWKFVLDKGGKDATGKKATPIPARYNPYIHTSRSPLNDQFKSAWIRPNLVTVEVEVPVSELTSGYKAERAKDAVGEVEWKSGSVSGELAKVGKTRRVILSRWDKPVRVLDNSEVAERIAELIGDNDITIPENVVTPQLRAELDKRGVKIGDPEKGVNKNEQVQEALKNGLLTDNSLVRFRENVSENGKSLAESGNKQAVVDELSNSLNTPITVYNSLEEIVDENPRRQRNKRAAKGWYDYKTGEVFVVMPNNNNAADIQATILHEIVAHKGLRKMFGEDFDTFLDNVYANATVDIRRKIVDMTEGNPLRLREATEEYLAELAEKGFDNKAERTLWEKVKDAFLDLLRKAGIKLDFQLTDNELRYILWRSYKQLQNENLLDIAEDITKRTELGIGDTVLRFREEGQTDKKDAEDTTVQEYEAALNKKNRLNINTYKAREAFQDSMLSVKILQETLEKHSGKEVRNFEDVYKAENQLGSKTYADFDSFRKKYFEPLVKELDELIKEDWKRNEDLKMYVYAKSGLERNEKFPVIKAEQEYVDKKKELDKSLIEGKLNDKQYDALLEQAEAARDQKIADSKTEDFSGLTGLMKDYNEVNGTDEKDFKSLAEKIVSEYESQNDTKGLWKAIRAVNDFTLRKEMESGLISSEQFRSIKNMGMDYYVPLRGWKEEVASDVYEYVTKISPVENINAKMKGRKSLAFNPLATMCSLAETAIVLGNRNKMKQKLFNLVVNRPSSLATVRDIWYVKNAEGKWEPDYPDLGKANSAEAINKALEEHEERMRELEKDGKAKRKHPRLDIGLKANKSQLDEHTVKVKINGQEYAIYIKANPRAAQALNGMFTYEKNKMLGVLGFYTKLKRLYGASMTSNNPEFILPNFVRDTHQATALTFMNYGLKGVKNAMKESPDVIKAVYRGIRGKFDPKNEYDVLFKEFLENGGETGYVQYFSSKDFEKDLERILMPTMSQKAYDYSLKKLGHIIEQANRMSEDITRFNAYVQSRKAGKTIVDSIDDAKNISVNFGRRGAGFATGGFWGTLAGVLNEFKLFFNPVIQGINIILEPSAKHMARFAFTLFSHFALGMLVPYLYDLFGDDDYWNQSDFNRMNNLIIGRIKIPMAPFFREIYGTGDIVYRLLTDRISAEDSAWETVSQVARMFSLEGLSNPLMFFVPDLGSPVGDIYENENFMGLPIAKQTDFNEFDPEYKRVYKGTNGVLVAASKYFNDITGGDDVDKSRFDNKYLNPAYIEHLLINYTGGIGKTLSNVIGSVVDLINNDTDNLTLRKIPVFGRFILDNDERTERSAINRQYYKITEEVEKMEHNERGYANKAASGDLDYLEKLASLQKSQRFNNLKKIISEIKKLEEKKKRIPDKYKDNLKNIDDNIFQLKEMAVEMNKDKE